LLVDCPDHKVRVMASDPSVTDRPVRASHYAAPPPHFNKMGRRVRLAAIGIIRLSSPMFTHLSLGGHANGWRAPLPMRIPVIVSVRRIPGAYNAWGARSGVGSGLGKVGRYAPGAYISI
jgi:hypothetical protein